MAKFKKLTVPNFGFSEASERAKGEVSRGADFAADLVDQFKKKKKKKKKRKKKNPNVEMV